MKSVLKVLKFTMLGRIATLLVLFGSSAFASYEITEIPASEIGKQVAYAFRAQNNAAIVLKDEAGYILLAPDSLSGFRFTKTLARLEVDLAKIGTAKGQIIEGFANRVVTENGAVDAILFSADASGQAVLASAVEADLPNPTPAPDCSKAKVQVTFFANLPTSTMGVFIGCGANREQAIANSIASCLAKGLSPFQCGTGNPFNTWK